MKNILQKTGAPISSWGWEFYFVPHFTSGGSVRDMPVLWEFVFVHGRKACWREVGNLRNLFSRGTPWEAHPKAIALLAFWRYMPHILLFSPNSHCLNFEDFFFFYSSDRKYVDLIVISQNPAQHSTPGNWYWLIRVDERGKTWQPPPM